MREREREREREGCGTVTQKYLNIKTRNVTEHCAVQTPLIHSNTRYVYFNSFGYLYMY